MYPAPKPLHLWEPLYSWASGQQIFFLQYTILQRGWASKMIERLSGNSVALDRVLDVSNQPLPYYKVILLMSLGSSLKQILVLAYISEQEMPATSAFVIAAFNTIFNSLNTILSLWSAASNVPVSGSWLDILRSPPIAIGIGAYLIGIFTELTSELQRRAFKKNPANKRKPYGGGLFSLATNINYGGYTLWRAGYALAAGGFTWGLLTFSFFFYDFTSRGVPVLDKYLTERVSVYPSHMSCPGVLSCSHFNIDAFR